ncbi:MAG: class I SAM-dependent methyltransferase [Acidimicrobiales bacterium]
MQYGGAIAPPSQYATDRNLRARQRLWEHQEPAFDVVGWTLGLAGVGPASRVLDVGCGNGHYLTAMSSLGAQAAGCDLSVGMLRAAAGAALVAADAVRLPFPGATFDVVLAPHMLYHVPDRHAAAHELRRVLRHGGTFVAVANGAGHLASLRAVVEAAARPYVPGWTWTDRLGEAFSLENGASQLLVAFQDVRCARPEHPGRAMVTDPDVIAGYVASLGDLYGHALPVSWDKVVEGVRRRASEVTESDGVFVVEGDVGAFVCR